RSKSSRLHQTRLSYLQYSSCFCLIKYWYTVTVQSTQIQQLNSLLKSLSNLLTLLQHSVSNHALQ
ncbi:phosphate acetyltransferase, partial [Vibrio parahaemolyticus AQ3810]